MKQFYSWFFSFFTILKVNGCSLLLSIAIVLTSHSFLVSNGRLNPSITSATLYTYSLTSSIRFMLFSISFSSSPLTLFVMSTCVIFPKESSSKKYERPSSSLHVPILYRESSISSSAIPRQDGLIFHVPPA